MSRMDDTEQDLNALSDRRELLVAKQNKLEELERSAAKIRAELKSEETDLVAEAHRLAGETPVSVTPEDCSRIEEILRVAATTASGKPETLRMIRHAQLLLGVSPVPDTVPTRIVRTIRPAIPIAEAQRRKYERWAVSLTARRARLERLKQTVTTLQIDLAEEEAAWLAEAPDA